MRFFNTEGLVRPDDHYAIPPLARGNADEILGLIQAKRYFVLHAPRQTGKTSALIALRDVLNSGELGEFRCEREYGLGRGRTDLLVLWPKEAGQPSDLWQRFVIECKVLRSSDRRSLAGTIERGVEQTLGYMEKCRAGEGHLVLFDRRDDAEKRTPGKDEAHGTSQITVWTL